MNAARIFRNVLPLLAGVAIAGAHATALTGQELTICSTVTTEQATSILGVAAKRTKDPSGCEWEDATHKSQLHVAYVAVVSMFASARSKSATTGKTQDETGLGGTAFSTIPSKYKGNRVSLYCLKGSTVLILDLEEAGASDRLPQMRDVMRKLGQP